MSRTDTAPPRYSLTHRWLHWIIALVFLGMIASGGTLGVLGFSGAKETFGQTGTNVLYSMHKSFGVALLLLMLARLAVRAGGGKPTYDPPIERWQKVVSTSVHHLLYILLFAQPVIGWLATGAGDFPVTFFGLQLPKILSKDTELSEWLYEIHGVIGILLLVLVVLHVGGALYHWRVRRDTVMTRMSLFRQG